MTNSSYQMKIVIYYSAWATICAAAAGVAISFIHTWFFSYNPGRSALMHTLTTDVVVALAIAAGQGAVALATGSVLARLGRVLQGTALLGVVIGVFDFIMLFVQMRFPATELGWIPDVAILAGVTVAITALGSRSAGAGAGAGVGTGAGP